MKLEILQENLNRALSSLNRVIETKPQVPILSNLLLSAVGGKLTLTASNLETSIIVELGAKITTEGDFTVPGRTFSEIISSLSAEKVLLEVAEGSVNIKSGGFSARVNGIAADQYPKLSPQNTLAQETYWEIDRQALLSALSSTTFSAAGDESRAVLTGVLFKTQEKNLVLVSTDGFRLSVVQLDKISLSKKEAFAPVIIPARSLIELARVLGEKEARDQGKTLKIFLSTTENQVYFDLGDTKIFSRLIAGNFPDYEKIIPSNCTLKVAVTAEELNKSLRLAAIFARESANIVKLKIANGKLKISANAAQVGENESALDVVVEGKDKNEDFSIAFNYRYLLDLLSVISGEVVMEFSAAVAPGLFKSPSAPNFFHIIMPVRVQE